jgi:hypothetical protein
MTTVIDHLFAEGVINDGGNDKAGTDLLMAG